MRLLMAANWKMYKIRQEAAATLTDLAERLKDGQDSRDVVVFAPHTALDACSQALAGKRAIALGGQNCYPAKEGAFTGEISPAMLRDCGCTWVLTGHSERRAILGESDALVGQKTVFALQSGLKVVLCIGETLAERDAGQLEAVLHRQLNAALQDLPKQTPAEALAVAYEPVWAIGTGRVAGPDEILESHACVRSFFQRTFPLLAHHIRILYGGSVKPENAKEILGLDNVNGVLVGGASLQAESFSRIVQA